MSILSRYIMKKLAAPFFFGLTVIMFIFLANFLIERFARLLSRDVPLEVIGEMMILSLAFTFALAVPMSVLIATLMSFGKMSADNEITAMKASGYGLHQAMIPVLLISMVVAYLLFQFNDKVLPDANYRLQLLMMAINKKKPTLQFQPGVFSDDKLIKDYSLLFREIDSESDYVSGVFIIDKSDHTVKRNVIAEDGTLRFNEREGKIILRLHNGEIHEVDMNTLQSYKKSKFKNYTIRIPVESSSLNRAEEGRRGDRSKNIAMMKADIERSKTTIEKRVEQMKNRIEREFGNELPELTPEQVQALTSLSLDSFALQNNGQYVLQGPENVTDIVERINAIPYVSGQIRNDLKSIENQVKIQNKLLVEIYKKYSIPFACIVFVLIGVPLGVKARHGGVAVGAGLSIFYFLLFWCFLIGGEQLADRRILDPWLAMWSANIIVGLQGLWLTARMSQETTFLEAGRFAFAFNLLTKGKSGTQ